MLLVIFICFMSFMEHAIVHGDPVDVVSNSKEQYADIPERRPNRPQAYLPPQIHEHSNGKNNKVIRKRSPGRVVDFPADVVEKLKNVDFSTLSPTLEVNKKMILDIHNELRCNADPPASNMLKLKWSEEAAEKAQEWANKCVQGHSPTNFKKLTRHRCSENILLTPYKVSWDVVARAWYSEKVDFKYGQGSINGAQTGHYTLLMWATSSEIGCGSAECPNLPNKYNYVCWMCPGGNKPPVHTPYKTGKPCSACPKACDGSLCTNACYWADNFKNCKTFLIGGTCQSDESLISDCPAMCKCTNGEIKEYD